jgi:UDP-N-acetyl-D-galactosamine dehydrogenase
VTAARHRIAVIGLGYAGLPVAVAFAQRFPGTIGFDVDLRKVRLRKREDPTGAVTPEQLAAAQIRFTVDPADLPAGKRYWRLQTRCRAGTT